MNGLPLSASLEEAKEHVELGKCVERLRSNPDWIKLIENLYLKEEAIRLVHAIGDQSLSDKTLEHLLEDMKAISNFRGFIETTLLYARSAEEGIAQYLEEENEVEGEIYEH